MSTAQQSGQLVETGDGSLSFDGIAKSLLAELQKERTAAGDLTENLPRRVFKTQQRLLEQLYAATVVRGDGNNTTTSAASDHDQSSIEFREAVIGDGEEHSCAKIFAILLNVEVSPGTKTWEKFLKSLNIKHPKKHDNSFRDDELPFDLEKVRQYFGDDQAEAIEAMQHEFCPPDLNSRFRDILKSLREYFDTVEKGLLIKCQKIDEAGQELDSDPVDYFFPDAALQEVADKEADSIKELYVEAVKAQSFQRRASKPRAQRLEVQKAQKDANAFFEGVKLRMKILGTLILIDVDPDSEMWKRFAAICVQNGPEASGLHDGLLPFEEVSDVERYLSSARSTNESFHHHQYRFCAAKLKKSQQVEVKGNRVQQRLPLLLKQYINSGTFGKVYRVVVKGGYLESGDQEFAMKVMVPSPENEGEWGSAQWLFKQQLSNNCIMKARASLRTSDHIYIFFPLAAGNLRKHMTDGLEPFCPPKTFEERVMFFDCIIGIAQALRYLHFELQDEGRHTMICIHEDLKAENVLVVNDEGKQVLKMTDFGISSIKRKLPGATSWQTIARNNMFERLSRSLRQQPSPTALGDDCPNFPPEAMNDGQVDASMDVWAFGVLFSEVLAWLSGGSQALKDFEKERSGKDDEAIQDYRSFEVVLLDEGSEKPVLRRGIQTWFSSLIERTSDPRDRNLYERSWWLLEKGLLVCDKDRRKSMKKVCEALIKIFNSEDPDGYFPQAEPDSAKSEEPPRETTEPSYDARTVPPQPVNGHTNNVQMLRRESKSKTLLRKLVPWKGTKEELAPNKSGMKSQDFRRKSLLGTQEHTAEPTRRHTSASTTTSFERDTSISQPGQENNLHMKLTEAIEAGNDEEALLVLQEGADWREVDLRGQTYLHRVSRKGMIKAVSFILKCLSVETDPESSTSAAALEAKDKDQATPLLLAIKGRHAPVATMLIDSGANVDTADMFGWTTLHYAARGSNTDLIKKLLDSSGSKSLVTRYNSQGETALHLCADSSSKASLAHAQRLLAKMPDIAEKADQAGRTPLFYVTEKRKPNEGAAMVEELLKHMSCLPADQLGRFATEYPSIQGRLKNQDQ